MFEILWLFCAWLPAPLNYIVFGMFSLVLVLVLFKLIAKVIDMIPFL